MLTHERLREADAGSGAARRYLEAHCGLTTEILVSRDRVDVLRCEFGIPFSRTIPDEEDE
ncbi:MAG: hypothetical protein ACLVEX_03850 [Ruthenibacterium lactatiformans]